MPFAAGVSSSSAPRKARIFRRSIDMLSGIARMSRYPLAAATKANPIPVLPEVGSTSVVLPGVISLRASASEIMAYPIRSLTELSGLKNSSFRSRSASIL